MRKPICHADIEWDEQGQPRSRKFDDIYFYQSSEKQIDLSGLEESRYVFIQQNQLAERWQTFLNSAQGPSTNNFVIGETGFGTGLNFLATWALWQSLCPSEQTDKHLHYISVEKYPLSYSQLKKALAIWPSLSQHSQQLLQHYPRILAPGFYHLQFAHAKLMLTLIIDDATDGLKQCLQSEHPYFKHPFGRGVDAWYLDGFAPRCNPQMWNQELFNTIAQMSHQHTTLSTFTAVGAVQRSLKSVGFQIEKVPGFAHKREMLRANFIPLAAEHRSLVTSSHTSRYPVPWAVNTFTAESKTVAIIGAGLAGCHTGRELAERGWQVILLDCSDGVGQGTSGNAHSIVYAKLSVDDDALAQFNLSALLVAEQCYQSWWRQDPLLGEACGVMQLAYNTKEKQLWQRCRDYFSQSKNGDDSVIFLNPAEASKIAGVSIDCEASFFPRLGWLNPSLLCQKLIDHPNITLTTQTEVAELKQQGKQWLAVDRLGKTLTSTTCLVVANASGALAFEQCQQLPLKNIRGQVSYLNRQQSIGEIKTVLCGEGYITPTTNQAVVQSLGASFNLHYNDLKLRNEDHQSNIDNLKKIMVSKLSHLESVDSNDLDGRCGFRSVAPDYLPIVGPLHQHQQFINDYQLLRLNAKASVHSPGQHWPGLFINVGHGSRGLAYTPLSARLLAAQINGDPLPTSRDLAEALHPGRFTIRRLIRRQL